MKIKKKKSFYVTIVLISLMGFIGIRYFMKQKMLETVNNYATQAGLENVSIEIDTEDSRTIYLKSSNFEYIEWDSLFSMHEKIVDIYGVETVIYTKDSAENGWMHYRISPGMNTIEGSSMKGRIKYTGAWDNFVKNTYDTTSLRQTNTASRDTTSNNNLANRSTDAKVCAKKVVEDKLKSPSTAKFCKYTEMTATNLGGDTWKVNGYVDAQNSFGATLREDWSVTLTLTSSGFTNATVTFY